MAKISTVVSRKNTIEGLIKTKGILRIDEQGRILIDTDDLGVMDVLAMIDELRKVATGGELMFADLVYAIYYNNPIGFLEDYEFIERIMSNIVILPENAQEVIADYFYDLLYNYSIDYESLIAKLCGAFGFVEEKDYTYNKVDKIIHFSNGSEILFSALDDPEKFKSLNLHWAEIEEASQVSDSTFKQLIGRLRNTYIGKNWDDFRYRLFG
mgnify:CR=1 FL=1